ncbi:endonuclease/exonuclease/phosphatase family metal-dependent hydrolase [Rhizobium sp. BK313]|uniref:endonuclease/exonuclease/phosphatase family protein n=1 Tax=Rhizobium sp. BK313 TaxID=2587081 RepID=UPI001061532E|nr:endonuclease/exonuclease/phosphatase family protein [Rhizobium sp. BK313]MBB3452677.1 endonuclease/exonuclease/phosphatase family metal-dependent hydrolase [Rhizobium sp. BK313]
MPHGRSIRILTYNVHSCIGTDRKIDPGRVAAVIKEARVDIVALQEIDVRRHRTGGVDQAGMIASLLKMEAHFNPALTLADEQYGDALITDLPTKAIKAGPLPSSGEPRGALSIEVMVGDRQLHLVNTHLGLRGRDRIHQMTTLLGPAWLKGSGMDLQSTILCGDFNAVPASAAYRLAARTLKDVQLSGNQPVRPTFPSRYPLLRLDHIFVSADLAVLGTSVPRNRLTSVASDHLPLIAEIDLGD